MEAIQKLENTNQNFKNVMLEIFLMGLEKFEVKNDVFRNEIESIVGKLYHSSLPQIKVHQHIVTCEGKSVDLNHAKLMSKVFLLFSECNGNKLTRDELIKKIYCSDFGEHFSIRRRTSLEHNVVKLISRSRSCAIQSFPHIEPDKFEWFYFDTSNKTWSLLKKK